RNLGWCVDRLPQCAVGLSEAHRTETSCACHCGCIRNRTAGSGPASSATVLCSIRSIECSFHRSKLWDEPDHTALRTDQAHPPCTQQTPRSLSECTIRL